jgi:hypothetical protein
MANNQLSDITICPTNTEDHEIDFINGIDSVLVTKANIIAPDFESV